MTADLVKRLRKLDYCESTWGLLDEAADRIEKLEAALREITEMDPLRPAFNCQSIARKALEGKDD